MKKGLTLIFLTLYSQSLFGQLGPFSIENENLRFGMEMKSFLKEEKLPSLKGPPKRAGKEVSKVKITAEEGSCGSFKLTFVFPETVVFKDSYEGNALFLSFNQTIDSPDLLSVQEKLAYLIKRFANGFNTLYLIPKKPVFYTFNAEGNIFTLEIFPDQEAPLPKTKSVKIAEARLLIEDRCYFSAFKALQQIHEEYPEDRDIPILLANLEALLPNWIPGINILCQQRETYPLDDDVKKLLYNAYTPHAPFFLVERQLQRTVSFAAVQVWRLQAEEIYSRDSSSVSYGGARFQTWRGHIASIVNSQGVSKGFKGSRSQGELYVKKEWDNGSYFAGRLYGQERAIGVSSEAGLLWPAVQGDLWLLAAWHRPNWEVFEALAFQGREDIVKVHANSTVNRFLSLSLEGGARRIGISGIPNGFTTALVGAQVFLNFVIPNPQISLNYALDAEYVTFIKVKRDASGAKFNPVPYTSYENHTLRLFLSYNWRDRWTLNAFGGETFNRLGLNAPTGGVSLRYVKPFPCGFEFELSFVQLPSVIISGATEQFFTGTFMTRF